MCWQGFLYGLLVMGFMVKDYEGHEDVDLIICEVRRCWQQ
jgi:hypothetical protein